MVSISGALMSKKEVLEPFLALILRDDLLSWHVSKAPVNRTEEQQKAVRVSYVAAGTRHHGVLCERLLEEINVKTRCCIIRSHDHYRGNHYCESIVLA